LNFDEEESLPSDEDKQEEQAELSTTTDSAMSEKETT